MSKQRNDNREPERANFYKVLVAIYYVLDSEFDFENLIIEHSGDITFDKNTQIEVKHIKTNLSNTSIDFWKTFYNWIVDENINEYKKLILHTTQKLPIKSIFQRWQEGENIIYFLLKQTYINEKGEPKKDTAFYYYKQIFNHKEDEIKKVISKIEIRHSQPDDISLIEEIGKRFYSFTLKSNIEMFVRNKLGGYVYGQVSTKGKWIISKSDFIRISSELAAEHNNKPLATIFDDYLMKDLNENEIPNYFNKKFVTELKKIDCNSIEINCAIEDYWKTASSIFAIDEFEKTFYDNEYKPYQKGIVFKRLREEKNKIKQSKDIKANLENTLDFYRNAITLIMQPFKSIPQLPYFQNGTMHRIVQNDDKLNLDFNWLIE
jgi:hypothetical protein